MKIKKYIVAVLIVFFSLILNLGALYADEENLFYSAVVKFQNNEFYLINSGIASKSVNLPVYDYESGYYVSLVDENNNIIKRDILHQLKETPISSGKDSIYLVEFLYVNKANKIVITDKGNSEKMTIDLAPHKTCGNNICEKNENNKICGMDCPTGSEDGYCDRVRDGICDIDCLSPGEAKDYDCDYSKESTSQIEKKSAVKKEADVKQLDKNINDYIKIIIFIISVLLGLGLIIFGIIKFKKIDQE